MAHASGPRSTAGRISRAGFFEPSRATRTRRTLSRCAPTSCRAAPRRPANALRRPLPQLAELLRGKIHAPRVSAISQPRKAVGPEPCNPMAQPRPVHFDCARSRRNGRPVERHRNGSHPASFKLVRLSVGEPKKLFGTYCVLTSAVDPVCKLTHCDCGRRRIRPIASPRGVGESHCILWRFGCRA
jgi:hypothetical protein